MIAMYETQGDYLSAATVAKAAGLLSSGSLTIPLSQSMSGSSLNNGGTNQGHIVGHKEGASDDLTIEIASFRGKYRCGRCGLIKVSGPVSIFIKLG